MDMGAHMAMPTDADILTLVQWLSPAYPVGAFAYSHGLEWSVEAGDVRTAQEVQDWISEVIEYGAGWNDCLFLIAAYHAGDADDLAQLDAEARAFSASSERQTETDKQGQAFGDVTSAVWAKEITGLCYPVAVGRAARLMNLPLNLTTQLFLHAFAANLVSAAMRLVPLGQTEGQRVIHDLKPLTIATATQAQDATLDSLGSTAFLSDIAAMKHETQYSRMFQT